MKKIAYSNIMIIGFSLFAMMLQTALPGMMICAIVIGGLLTPVQASSLVFFGEDLNFTDNLNTLADDPLRPTSLLNSTAAETDFFAQLRNYATENFESYQAGITPGTLAFGHDTATLSGSPTILNVPTDTFNGTYPTSGNEFLYLFGPVGSIELTFKRPLTAFGFFATDVGDGGAHVILSDISTTDIIVPNTVFPAYLPYSVPNGSGSVFFFGVIDTDNPFRHVTITNTNSTYDGFGLDDMTIGRAIKVKAVPEPSTMLLFGSGLAGLVILRKQFKS